MVGCLHVAARMAWRHPHRLQWLKQYAWHNSTADICGECGRLVRIRLSESGEVMVFGAYDLPELRYRKQVNNLK